MSPVILKNVIVKTIKNKKSKSYAKVVKDVKWFHHFLWRRLILDIANVILSDSVRNGSDNVIGEDNFLSQNYS